MEHLRSNVATKNAPVLGIFFNYKEHDSQTPVALMGSMLRQLIQQSYAVPVSVRRLHDRRGVLPSLSELVSALCDALGTRDEKRAYIIVDAVDECPDHAEIILRLLSKLGRNVQLLATSRNPALDVFRDAKKMTVIANNDDIRQYVNQKIDISSRLSKIKLSPEVREQIICNVVEKACGMYVRGLHLSNKLFDSLILQVSPGRASRRSPFTEE